MMNDTLTKAAGAVPTKVVCEVHTIDPSVPILPAWARAGIYFVKDAAEYIFAARTEDKDGAQIVSKFLRPVDVVAAFTQQEDDTGWIQPNIVRMGNSTRGFWFIYRRGAEIVPILFDGDRQRYLIPLPSTVLVRAGNAYYIFATRDEKPLSDGTPLFRAPFPNVYDNGGICWGANHPPRNANPDSGEKAWGMFFGSPFNTHLDGGHIKAKENLLDFLKALGGRRKFPVEKLVENNYNLRTMKDMLKTILKTSESDGQ